MSNYEKGDWCRIWDSLYWRFLYKHRERLSKNPRIKPAISNFDRMDAKKTQRSFSRCRKIYAKPGGLIQANIAMKIEYLR